jgi:hypothetical protein
MRSNRRLTAGSFLGEVEITIVGGKRVVYDARLDEDGRGRPEHT